MESKKLERAVRRGIVNASINQDALGAIFFELLIVSGLFAYYYKSSNVFFGVFITLFILMMIRKTAVILLFVLALAWGALGFFVFGHGQLVSGGIFGLVFFVVALGINMAGLEGLNDIT